MLLEVVATAEGDRERGRVGVWPVGDWLVSGGVWSVFVCFFLSPLLFRPIVVVVGPTAGNTPVHHTTSGR